MVNVKSKKFNSKNSNKHIFEVQNEECVVYTIEEIEIIKENMKDFFHEETFNKVVKLSSFGIELDITIKDFIDDKKFEIHVSNILTIDKIVFVNINDYGEPTPHGKTKIKYIEDQLKDLT